MIQVNSEIKKLKKVLLYCPGEELKHLVPANMKELLFDDIPFLDIAEKEHDFFAGLLMNNGAEVVYLDELMAETLDENPQLRLSFLKEFVEEGLVKGNVSVRIAEYLDQHYQNNLSLIRKLIAGVQAKEIPDFADSFEETVFLLEPVTNLYFQRDPIAVIGNGICINHMHTKTRRRETLFYDYIFRYHKDYKGTPIYYSRNERDSIEGGDVLNLSKKTIAIGISERTSYRAVKKLAKRCFKDKTCELEEIVAFFIPKTRAYMHLDTVFTQVDENRFVVHPHAVRQMEFIRLFTDKKGNLIEEKTNESLEAILARILGTDHVELLYCGGGDEIAAEREQWSDGSNTFCISPGVIVTYDRNRITNDYLISKGLKVLEMPSSELSRGRGGPHCMSLPLIREE